MGLFDYIKTQFLEIIQWEDDARDVLSWRFPDQDKEIKKGAQLIVRESQVCQFVYLGQFGDTFSPGKHSLTTDNIPILSTLKGWKYGFESPFKADVFFVNTRLFTGNRWGTSNPIMMRDADFGMVRVRAFGTYDFHVTDPKVFLKEVVGTNQIFRLESFADTMRSRFVSVFSDALGSAKVPVLDLAARYSELGDALLPHVNPILAQKYGLELSSFIVENISLPPEVEQAIDKRSSMGAIGNLNDYIKLQMANSLGKEGGAQSPATSAAEMAMGFGMAQQMMNPQTGIFAQQQQQQQYQQQQPAAVPPPFPAAAAPAASAPQAAAAAPLDLLSPADAAGILGVSEADVIATLTDGSLKGKKIGSTWRITRTALDEFLKS